MTRYFMSIPEAAQLVMQAGAIGSGGEIFVLDMGEPVKIVDLAKDMIRLMGLNAGEDIDIVYTGLRPGEKIHEELVSHSEEIEKTLHEKIMLVKTSSVEWQSFREKIDELFSDMNALDLNKMRNMLAAMISENEVN
jgi:FlaA1/EpsC-like NDP-sugar epimerase